MYLSRLILNPGNRRVQRELADLYQLHKTLLRGFPDGLDRERDRVLFRVESDGRTGIPTVLVQSTLEPSWSWLEGEQHRGYLRTAPECKPFDLHLVAGQVLAFRLRANPTVKRRFNDKDHKRVGICREEEQLDWLRRKGEQGGFRLLSAQAIQQGDGRGLARKDDQVHKLHLLAVQFDGMLQVTDPDRLRETLRQGIGSGKGFGFGLLSLARPPA